VAAGDVNGDGKADVIAGLGAGGQPSVSVFSGADFSLLGSFLADNGRFMGGVRVSTARPNRQGEVVAASGSGSAPRVNVFDFAAGAFSPVTAASFLAAPPSFTGGLYLAGGGHA